MSWNTTLFMLLNASEQPGGVMLLAAELAAISPVLLAPVLLTCAGRNDWTLSADPHGRARRHWRWPCRGPP